MVQEGFIYQPASRKDLPKLVHHIQQMALESEGRELNLATLTRGVEGVFAEPHRGVYWVIQTPVTVSGASELIGNTLVTPEWSDWHGIPYWWIQSVYIQPAFRGKGFLGELFRHIEQAAEEAKVPEVRLYVEQNNQRAIQAYEKVGYAPSSYLIMEKTLEIRKPERNL